MRELNVSEYQGDALVPLQTLVLPLGTNQLDIIVHFACNLPDGTFFGGTKTYTMVLPDEIPISTPRPAGDEISSEEA